MLRPVFEARPRKPPPESGAPKDFDVNLSQVTQDEAYATILARLEDAKARLPEGTHGRILIHPYVDGSVDGELYMDVPDGEDTRIAEFDMQEAFDLVSVGQRYWISVGARYQVKTDDERYKRSRGMVQVQTNYQRANRANIAESHLILRNKIARGMDRTFGEEAEHLFIRLHWNPENGQPKR